MNARKRWMAVALAIGLSGPAYAASLSYQQANRTAGHVKKHERHDAFHLRRLMGGAFDLGGTYCERQSITAIYCRWDATAVLTNDGSAGYGMRHRCTIEVRIRAHGERAPRWRRVVIACADQNRSAP